MAQARNDTRLPSETNKLSASRSARSAVTRFVPSYPALQVTLPYLMQQEWPVSKHFSSGNALSHGEQSLTKSNDEMLLGVERVGVQVFSYSFALSSSAIGY